jgi:peptidoglycan/xylan/chitin deacetylase (PgdA/CDA1 family)
LIPNPSELAVLGSMLVLNFHCIGRPRRELVDGEADVCVDRQRFAEILDVVSGHREVRLTFDDGNRSDVTEALPELLQRGLSAEFFICPARFGTVGFVDQHDVRELLKAGMSIGSHGMDHVRWRKLAPWQVDREIVQAKQVLEDALQAPVESAACPFGAYDRRTLTALRDAGFKRVYTSDRGRAISTDWLVPRNTVRHGDSAESIERMVSTSPGRLSLTSRGKQWIKRRR